MTFNKEGGHMQRKNMGVALILLLALGLWGCTEGPFRGSDSSSGSQKMKFTLEFSSETSSPSNNLRPEFLVKGSLGDQAFTGELFWGSAEASCKDLASLSSMGPFMVAKAEKKKSVSVASDLLEGSYKIFAKLSWKTQGQKTMSKCFGGVEYVVDLTTPVISKIEASDGGYGESANLDVSVYLSEAVNVTGTPRILLEIGGGTKYADYVQGTGSSTLIFRYTVESADSDSSGIEATSPVELTNNGVIKDIAGNDISALGLSFTSPDLSGVIVNGALPAGFLSFSRLSVAPGHYSVGSDLDITVVFSGDVTVTGVPRMALSIGGSTQYADYVEGTSSSTLIFRYTVMSGDSDEDGIEITSPVELNGGSIEDAGEDAISLDFSPPSLPGVRVDTGAPAVLNVIVDNGSYGEGSPLDVKVSFSEDVVVTGNPQVALAIGGNSTYATYHGGRGSSTLTFRYTVVSGDSDENGIEVTSPVELNGGSIEDAAGNASTLSFTPPGLSGVMVETVAPTITSVTVESGSYGNTSHLDVKVNFSEVIKVTGNPRLALDIGGAPKYAVYDSGGNTQTLTFRYVVASADRDGDGIGMTSPLELSNGTIVDAAGNSIRPAGLSFSLPGNLNDVMVNGSLLSDHLTISSVTLGDDSYGVGSHLDISVVFSDVVTVDQGNGTPLIALDIGGAASKYASYLPGVNSTTLVFRYTVVSGDNDDNGIGMIFPIDLSGGVINDANGNATSLNFRPPHFPGVIVDTTAPTISSVSVQGGTYGNSSSLDMRVVFSEVVEVDETGGTPRIALVIGESAKYASYVLGTGSRELTFRYTVVMADNDSDGIGMTPSLDLNSGSLTDAAQNAITALAFTSPSNLNAVLVDGTTASINSVAVNSGRYKENNVLNIVVNFSETVAVNRSGGTPRIALDIGGNTKYADYTSGDGETDITFSYTIVSGDNDSNGITMTSLVDLNSAEILDAEGVAVSLNFSPPANLGDVLVDTMAPRALGAMAVDGRYGESSNLDVTVEFSEVVVVTGAPQMTLHVGGSHTENEKTATFYGGSGSSTLTFRYLIASGDSDRDGIGMASPLELNSGTIKDLAGNVIEESGLAFTLPSLSGVLVDTTAPTISSSNVRATEGSYSTGENLDVIVSFSENVEVIGTPQIVLGIGEQTKHATYSEGGGTQTLTFRYVVVSGDNDSNGIGLSSPLQLNSGTIKDMARNSIVQEGLVFTPSGADVLSNVLVDTTAPTILRVNAQAESYGESADLDVSVTFVEAVLVSGVPRIKLTVGNRHKIC